MAKSADSALVVRIDNGEPVNGDLSIEVEPIEMVMSPRTVPDMAWEYVDQAGHYHAWADDGTLPTLVERTAVVDCGDSDDGDCEGPEEITERHCAICDETIEPKMIVSRAAHREFVPGRKTWSVTAHTLLNPSDRVSVVIIGAGFTGFGIGTVGGAMVGPFGVGETQILGVGPLGRRKTLECICDLVETTTREQAARGESGFIRGRPNGCLIHSTEEDRVRLAAAVEEERVAAERREAAMKAAREA